jgi:sulfoxide reductase heme-binding subunit YedZ
MNDLMEGPLLWFLNRGSGFVLLAALTATVVLGILATQGSTGGRVPRFVTQTLHRDVGLVSAVLLVVHVATAVVDSYVDITWWQALSPFGATYEPLWLGLGALSLDLILVVIVTSMLRHRMPHRLWRTLHFSTYAAWVVGVAHGLGIGTDTGTTMATAVYVGCLVCVLVALGLRIHWSLRARQSRKNTPDTSPYLSGVIR